MKKFFVVIAILTVSIVSVPAMAVTSSQQKLIKEKCNDIKTSLVNLQHEDSRVRVYLGRYYEIVLNKFIVPLNLRLVENNTSNNNLMESQSNFSVAREKFVNDYISYQQSLEELVAVNCTEEPAKFYEKLVSTRSKRKMVSQDAVKLETLAGKQINLVQSLKETIK